MEAREVKDGFAGRDRELKEKGKEEKKQIYYIFF